MRRCLGHISPSHLGIKFQHFVNRSVHHYSNSSKSFCMDGWLDVVDQSTGLKYYFVLDDVVFDDEKVSDFDVESAPNDCAIGCI